MCSLFYCCHLGTFNPITGEWSYEVSLQETSAGRKVELLLAVSNGCSSYSILNVRSHKTL